MKSYELLAFPTIYLCEVQSNSLNESFKRNSLNSKRPVRFGSARFARRLVRFQRFGSYGIWNCYPVLRLSDAMQHEGCMCTSEQLHFPFLPFLLFLYAF